MLKDVKGRSFDRLFYRYNAWYLLRRYFRFFGIVGSLSPEAAGNRPLLYLMNHSSWWDGLLAYHAARTLTEGKHYFMMEEAQLEKYRFFRRLGAYSINPSRSADVLSSLRYTAGLLREGGRVWMYPQGEIRPLDERPVGLKQGAALVLRLCPDAAVVPVTLYHGLYLHSKPEAVLLAGEPLMEDWKEQDRREIGEILERTLNRQLEQHRRLILDSGGDFQGRFRPLIRQGESVNERFDRFFGFRRSL